jgi:hypothetical protein
MSLLELSQVFNRGLDILLVDEALAPERLALGEAPGLALAMNNFFSTGHVAAEDGESVTTKGFNYNVGPNYRAFERVEINVKKEPEEDPAGGFVGWDKTHEFFHVDTGKTVTASELVGSEILLKTADYLKTTIGNERAASLLETLPTGSNVMEAMQATISIVAMENGGDQAIEYVRYLNGGMKQAINSLSPNYNTFNGWILHAPDNKSSKPANSGWTMHSGHTSSGTGMLDVLDKGHMALDWNWLNKTGVGVIPDPIDLNKLYDRLR